MGYNKKDQTKIWLPIENTMLSLMLSWICQAQVCTVSHFGTEQHDWLIWHWQQRSAQPEEHYLLSATWWALFLCWKMGNKCFVAFSLQSKSNKRSKWDKSEKRKRLTWSVTCKETQMFWILSSLDEEQQKAWILTGSIESMDTPTNCWGKVKSWYNTTCAITMCFPQNRMNCQTIHLQPRPTWAPQLQSSPLNSTRSLHGKTDWLRGATY